MSSHDDEINCFYRKLQEALESDNLNSAATMEGKSLLSSCELARVKKSRERRNQREEEKIADLELERMENSVKAAHIEEFIEQHFPGTNFEEKRYLKREIRKEIDTTIGLDFRGRIEEFLTIGLKGIRKQQSKEKIKKNGKTALRYLWAILINLIGLAIVVSVFSTTDGTFEVIVVSILLFTYTTISSHARGSGLVFQSFFRQADLQFLDIRKILGRPATDTEREVMETAAEKIAKQYGPLLINQFAVGLVDLIAFWNVIKAVGWI
jgi:hypothetical protein